MFLQVKVCVAPLIGMSALEDGRGGGGGAAIAGMDKQTKASIAMRQISLFMTDSFMLNDETAAQSFTLFGFINGG